MYAARPGGRSSFCTGFNGLVIAYLRTAFAFFLISDYLIANCEYVVERQIQSTATTVYFVAHIMNFISIVNSAHQCAVPHAQIEGNGVKTATQSFSLPDAAPCCIPSSSNVVAIHPTSQKRVANAELELLLSSHATAARQKFVTLLPKQKFRYH
eukprot:IDg3909t1